MKKLLLGMIVAMGLAMSACGPQQEKTARPIHPVGPAPIVPAQGK